MLINLPYEFTTFLVWYFVKFPKKLLTVGFRFVSLVNNQVSFTLNLKLLFTPLFGDYTKMGRLIGFVVRIFQSILGLIAVIVLSVFTLFTPVFWIVIPFYTAYKFNIVAFIYVLLIFLIKVYVSKDVPRKRVSQVTDDYVKAFRPNSKLGLELLEGSSKIPIEFLNNPSINLILKRLEIDNNDFKNKISSITIDFSGIQKSCYSLALEQKTRYVEIEQLFYVALSMVPKIDVVLASFGSSLDYAQKAVDWLVSERESLATLYVWQEDFSVPKMSGAGKGMTGHVTPFLDSVSQDFTSMAQHGQIKKVVAHQKEIKQITELIGGSNTNVLLVGPPGCGKTSVIKGIAYDIIHGTDVDSIRFKRIVAIDTASLLSGTRSAGDISERISRLMEEAKSSRDIILFFDEIHNLVSGASTDDGSTIFSLIEPHIADSKIQFLGATNHANYRKYIEPNGSFSRLFQLIDLEPASDEETLEIIQGIAREREKEYGVLVTFPALEEILTLSKKLIHDRVFPDKAIDILNRTVSNAKQSKYITAEHVRKEISDVTHVPVTHLTQDESEKLLGIEKALKARVIGQDHAITQIAKALQRARVGIRDDKKPIASFLFVGTTGVGKTETAKALAAEYFGDSKAMIRLDMSEYQQQDSISRLLGDPNGNTKGILTEAVLSRPFALILLDEIEKAYSSILLTFLQVLDDGRLTDSSGTTVDFTNTIIIATSNVGTKQIQEAVSNGSNDDEMTEVAFNAVRDHYAPEFLNRFTGIIVYKPLEVETVKKIADLMLNRIRKIADEKGIKITFKPELLDMLVEKGFNKDWGARSMSRVIEDYVESYLAVKLLSQEIKRGDVIELGREVFDNIQE